MTSNGVKKMGVLVTRPAQQCVSLCRLLDASGQTALCLPAVDIVPAACIRDWEGGVCARMSVCQILIFTSPSSVHACLSGVSLSVVRQTFSTGALRHVRCIAMGPGTYRALQGYAVAACRPDTTQRAGSATLLQMPVLSEGRVRGKTVGIVTGEGGRPVLRATLQKRGAKVENMAVYRRCAPPVQRFSLLMQQLAAGSLQCVVVTSVSALVFMLAALSDADQRRLKHIPLVVISERIQVAAQRRGFGCVYVTEAVSDAAIHACVLSVLGL